MKKTIFLTFLTLLTACSAQNTPDFILKHTDEEAYNYKKAKEACKYNVQNRIIQIDGVVDYYQYNSGDIDACINAELNVAKPYAVPNRYAKDRPDVKPIDY